MKLMNKRDVIIFYTLIAILISSPIAYYLFPDRIEFVKWGYLLVIINIVPILIFFRHKVQNIFPFIPIVAAYNLFAFALPTIFLNVDDYQLGALNIDALKYTSTGLSLFYLFILIGNKLLFSNLKIHYSPLASNISGKELKKISYVFLFLAIIGKLFVIPTITDLGQLAVYFYIGITIYLRSKNLNNRIENIIFILFVSSEIVIRLASSLLAQNAFLLLYIGVISYIVHKRIRKSIIIFTSLFFIFYLLFNPIKFEYRTIVWFNKTESFSFLEKINIIGELIINGNSSSSTIAENFTAKDSNPLKRTSYQLSALSHVINYTPNVVPYMYGESYLPLLTKFIPRIIWTNKPREDMGQVFGHRYYLLAPQDYATAMNFPWLAELFANFGLWGIIIGMSIFGLMYSFFDRFFNSIHLSIPNKIISYSFLFTLSVQESNFSMLVGQVILGVLAFYFTLKILIRVK